MDFASLPLILLAAAPGRGGKKKNNHCLEVGGKSQSRRCRIETLLSPLHRVPVWLDGRSNRKAASCLCFPNRLLRSRTNRETFRLCFCWVCVGTSSLLPVWGLRVRMWVSEGKRKKTKKKREKLNTVFLLSLKCHERSADAPAGVEIELRASEPRSDAWLPQLPRATSCPKGKDLHFLLGRNGGMKVISITSNTLQQLEQPPAAHTHTNEHTHIHRWG